LTRIYRQNVRFKKKRAIKAEEQSHVVSFGAAAGLNLKDVQACLYRMTCFSKRPTAPSTWSCGQSGLRAVRSPSPFNLVGRLSPSGFLIQPSASYRSRLCEMLIVLV
jgi:hypothetical protein